MIPKSKHFSADAQRQGDVPPSLGTWFTQAHVLKLEEGWNKTSHSEHSWVMATSLTPLKFDLSRLEVRIQRNERSLIDYPSIAV